MNELYFRNVKTGKKYKIVKLDIANKEVTLQGEYSTFVEPYDKERFKANGYVLEKDQDHAEQDS